MEEKIPSGAFDSSPKASFGEVILIILNQERGTGESWYRNEFNYFRFSCFNSHGCRQYLHYISKRDVYLLTWILIEARIQIEFLLVETGQSS